MVLLHTYNSVWQENASATTHAVAIFVTKQLPAFVVPLFFAISGYLFFLNSRQWSFRTYLEKLHRRCFTLFYPYLVWNLLAFGLYGLRDCIGGKPLEFSFSLDIFWGCRETIGEAENLLGWSMHAYTKPVLLAFWFVRDLICMALLSPLVYGLVKYLRWGALLLTGVVYYGGLWTNPLGITFIGPWFFTLGAWLAIQGKDVLQIVRKLRIPALFFVVVSPMCFVCIPSMTELMQPFYVLSSMVVAVGCAHLYSNRHTPSRFLGDSSFFLYAAHTIFLLPVTVFLATLTSACSTCMQLGGLLLSWGLGVGLSLWAFHLLRHFFPRCSSWLTALR